MRLQYGVLHTIIMYYLDKNPSDTLQKKYDESRRILFRHMMRRLGDNVKKVNETILRDLWSGFMIR
jgi:hypothetical protein